MNQKLAKALRKARRALDGKGKVSDLDIMRIDRNREREYRLSLVTIKPIKVRKRRELQPIPPTWPKTPNQMKQGRPVIVIKPVRYAQKKMPFISVDPNWPKHVLDSYANYGRCA